MMCLPQVNAFFTEVQKRIATVDKISRYMKNCLKNRQMKKKWLNSNDNYYQNASCLISSERFSFS